MTKGLGLIVAAIATHALLVGAASAQEDLTRYPTNVPLSSEMSKLQKPNPEACDRLTASRLDANILRVHDSADRCSAYSRDMYWQYVRRKDGFTSSTEERNDPINYFRWHNIDIGPYEAALAQLGFGQHDVYRRTGGAAFSAQAAAGVQPAPQATAAPASGETGACGIAVSTGLTAVAQAEAQRLGTCEQIRLFFAGR